MVPPKPACPHPALADAPAAPGVYLMKDARGAVLYVGKARNLRSRVRSYFTARGDERPAVTLLRDKVCGVEYVTTANEHEALVLEDRLIKEYQPRYNMDLKDDQRYFSVKLTLPEPFPRLLLVHQREDDGACYFGPFSSGSHVKRMLRRLQQKYRLRRCPGPAWPKNAPCLYAQIDACAAPCTGAISAAEYQARVKDLITFLRRAEQMTANAAPTTGSKPYGKHRT